MGDDLTRKGLLARGGAGLVAIGVSGAAAPYAFATGRARRLTKVRYMTGFGNLGRDSYVWAAKQNGYFEREGIDVEVIPGVGSLTQARLLATDKIDFCSGDLTAIALGKGNESLPVKAVAVVHQRNMATVLTLRESGIKTPKQLEGKTIADSAGSAVQILFGYFAKKAGIDASTVKFAIAAPQAQAALLSSKQVDGIDNYVVGLATYSASVGPLNSIPFAQAIPNLIGNCIWAREDMISQTPDFVRRFVRALMKGYQFALDNPGRAGAILNQNVPFADYKVAAEELRLMKKYGVNADTKTHGIGWINAKRVASSVSIVNNFFKPTHRVTVSDVAAFGLTPPAPRG